jgi:uncharacterized membrane protein YdbT with pleckstrin-like domain
MKIVAWQARIHWIQLLWPSIASIFFVLIADLLFSGAMSPHGSVGGTGILAVGALLFLVAALLVAGFAFVSWQSRKVILTDKKLRVISGLFKERIADIFLNTIESVVVQQGIVGRMLGFGTIILRDRDGIVHRLKKIAQPTKCLRKLQELLGQEREHGC